MIDRTRHISIFDSEKMKDRIDVIGAGATGSRVVVALAKLGLTNIHVWDFDMVEEHNIANQTFGNSHIGRQKVHALYEQVEQLTGTKIHIHNEKVDGTQSLGEIIFLLTDTMSSRKEIWDNGIKLKFARKLMIETRMGTNVGRIYTINPCDLTHIKKWEKSLCDDDVAEVSSCGSSISLGPTADILSGYAIWQMMRWFNEEVIEEELIFSTSVPVVLTSKFVAA